VDITEQLAEWNKDFRGRLESCGLLSPTQLSRAVVANGGQVSKQVAWRWINGHSLTGAKNLLPVCRCLGLKANSKEEAIFIRSWLEVH